MHSSITKTSSISKSRPAPVPPLQPPSSRLGSKGGEENRPWWKQPLPIFCIALPLLIAAGLLARIGYRNIRERMQVRAAKKLQDELFSEAGRNLSDDERREKFKKLGEMRETLSPKQQNEMWAPRREAMRQEMQRFFEMSPQDQVAFLDKRIKEDEERIQRWRQMRAQGGGGGGGGGGNGGAGGATGGGGGQAGAGGGAGGSGAGGSGAGGGRAGGGGPGGGPGGGGPGGGWGRGGGPGGGGGGPGAGGGGGGAGGGGFPGGPGGRGAWNDPTQRQTMIKNMLDGTTPEERAQRSLFMQMMQQRRTQLGMPPSPWGPR